MIQACESMRFSILFLFTLESGSWDKKKDNHDTIQNTKMIYDSNNHISQRGSRKEEEEKKKTPTRVIHWGTSKIQGVTVSPA